MKTKFDQNKFDKMRSNPDNYKWGFFYYNKKDKRFLMLRKTGVGFSVNFAHPYLYLVILGIIVLAVLLRKI